MHGLWQGKKRMSYKKPAESWNSRISFSDISVNPAEGNKQAEDNRNSQSPFGISIDQK